MTPTPLILEDVCSDPYWNGCKESPAKYRNRIWSDPPDTPTFLCQGCFDQMVEDGHIDPSEWNDLGDYYVVVNDPRIVGKE